MSQPGLVLTHDLNGASSSYVPERGGGGGGGGGGGVLRRDEHSLVVIISYKGYSPPKCTCNGRTKNTHPSKIST